MVAKMDTIRDKLGIYTYGEIVLIGSFCTLLVV